MKSVKIGNDVRNIEIPVSRLGVPFSTWDELINLKLYAVERKRKNYSVVPSTVLKEEGQLVLYFESKDLTAIGVYDFLMTFSIVDPINPSGFQHKSISIENLFAIVETTAQEKDSGDEFTIDLNYAVDGHSYYQIWSQYYTGTEEDMFAWHRQPAVDAAAYANEKGAFAQQQGEQAEQKAEQASQAAGAATLATATLTGTVNNKLSQVDVALGNVDAAFVQIGHALQASSVATASANTAAEQTQQVKQDTLIVKGETQQVKQETEEVRQQTLAAKGETETATAAANQAANLATEKAKIATEKAELASTAATNADTARTNLTNAVNTKLNEVDVSENIRQNQESTRVANENTRIAAENARNISGNTYNVTIAIPLTAGQFYTSTTARAAVPTSVRKRGLILTYETSAGVWYSERFKGANVSTWATESDWEVVPSKLLLDEKVNNTGNETIAGIKTFSSSPIVPAPTNDTQAATKKYVDDSIRTASENWVGVIIGPNSSTSEPAPKSTVIEYRATELQRTGNLNYHRFGKSRIFNAIYPAIVVRSTRKVAWRLDKNDFTKKDDGSVSVPDWTIHNICIVIPRLWRRIVLLDGVNTGRYEVRYDIAPFEGAEVFCNETAHSIGFASMDRTTTQLVSVISNDVRYRGGNNVSTNDANAWNWNSLLGKPATTISRTAFENNAAAAGWETGNIWDRTLWQQLMWLYFANTNIQLPYTSVLTAEGYPQGGSGAGVTNWLLFRWSAKNGNYPINTIGAGSLSVGCKVGVRDMVDDRYYIGQTTGIAANNLVATDHFSTVNGWSNSYIGLTVQNMTTLAEATIVSKTNDSTLVLSADIFLTSGQWFWIKGVNQSYQIPVFFGIENLYGELWEYVSGINIEKQAEGAGAESKAYVCKDFTKRSANITGDYRLIGIVPRTDGYIRALYPELNIPRINTGASSSTYMSDSAIMTAFPASGVAVYACRAGGAPNFQSDAGVGCVLINALPSSAITSIGARLRAEIVI